MSTNRMLRRHIARSLCCALALFVSTLGGCQNGGARLAQRLGAASPREAQAARPCPRGGGYGCQIANILRHNYMLRQPPGSRTMPVMGAPTPAVLDASGRMPIDLPTAMRLASNGNLSAQFVREKVREAHAMRVQAGQWWLPTIKAGVRLSRIDGKVQGTEGDVVTVHKENLWGGAGIRAHWEIGEGKFRELAAQRRVTAANMAWSAGQRMAALRASEAYVNLLKAQAAEQVALESVNLFQSVVTETQAKKDAGGGFEGDIVRARARVSRAKLQVRRAHESRRVASLKLAEVLNLPSGTQLFATEPSLVQLHLVNANVSAQSLVSEAVAVRPDVREATALGSAARAEQRATIEGVYYPDVTFGYESGLFGDRFDGIGGQGRFGLAVEWEFGPGGIGDRSRMAAATSRYRQSILHRRQVEQKVATEVHVAHAQVHERAQAVLVAQQTVRESQQALSLYRERQKIGVGEPLDAILAEEALTEARMDYINAVGGYNKAQVRLLYATGRSP